MDFLKIVSRWNVLGNGDCKMVGSKSKGFCLVVFLFTKTCLVWSPNMLCFILKKLMSDLCFFYSSYGVLISVL